MMRSIGVLFFFLFPILATQAREIDTTAVADLRELAQSIEFEHQARVLQMIDWNDSLRMNRKKWMLRYDSLFKDSAALTDSERCFLKLDGSLLAFMAQPSAINYASLKLAFQAFQPVWPQAENYNLELNAIMLEVAISQNDLATAYALQNKLHTAQYAEWKAENAARIATVDSLRSQLESSGRENTLKINAINEKLMLWHLIAVATGGVLLIFLVVFLVMKGRWTKQRNALKAKADDTSEREVLVQKLEEARREIVELKTLAKKRAEAPAVVVQSSTENKGLSAAEVAEWNDELQQALAKIKTHCEAGKHAMDVPTYMSIVNDVTRLSSRAGKKSEQWMTTLSSK